MWYKYLTEKLRSIGFTPSEAEPCILYSEQGIYLLYTDDTIIFGPNREIVDRKIKEIRSTGLKLTEEGSVADFLGVRVQEKSNGAVHLTQPTLIRQVIQDLHMDPDMTPGRENHHPGGPIHQTWGWGRVAII